MLSGQVFELSDIGKVALLVVLEELLSADNALILAIIVRHLPKAQQRKALFYGLAGAFVLRFAAILLAASILNFWWLQVIGSLYLIYLPVKHFIKHSQGSQFQGKAGAGFWMTVVYADLIDLVFAIDSVLVAVAVVNSQSKIWIVYAGAFIGIVLLRFAAGFCLRLLERYPILDHVAYALVGWAGVKMLFISGETWEKWYADKYPNQPLGFTFPHMHPAIFWGGMAAIVAVGIFIAIKNPAQPHEPDEGLKEAEELFSGKPAAKEAAE
jgi:YkoY family integral membrane protein